LGSKRFLFTFGIAGGLVSGLVIGLMLMLLAGVPATFGQWLAVLLCSTTCFTAGGWLTWFQWASRRARTRAQAIAKLAQGDLATHLTNNADPQGDLRRLMLSLRRAIAQVQRVTSNVHRTGRDLMEQARLLLESARRQGQAVDRTLEAVSGMGESLGASGRRVTQLETFAQETTTSLSEMTERIEQVAGALGMLDAFAHKTSAAVATMGERLAAVAQSGDVLARFAAEAEDFVSAVEGGIDAVRRRANETGDLAREVTNPAERGGALVNDSVQGMYRLEQTVRKASEIVDSLGRRSLEIRRIVDVIQEVADQTNLLALNAAIIAAGAGEQGRAFGVVSDEIRSLAERTARSTREIAKMVGSVRAEVETAVTLVADASEKARAGVQLGDRAASALKEIRAITGRTFEAVEATVAETARLQNQGASVVEASQKVGKRVGDMTQAATDQASHGRELVRQTQEMARLAQSAHEKAQGQAKVGRELSDSVLRLTAAIDEIRAAQAVLTRGDAAISEEVAQVREDARAVVRIADGLSRTVDQLSHEANGLEEEVFRFRLPPPRRGGTLRVGIHQSAMFEATRGLDPLFTLDNQLVEIGANMFRSLVRSEDGVLVPELAERWEISPSARRFRFNLRRNVQFHDGQMLTAKHVKQHFERLLDPAVNSPDSWIVREIEGAQDFISGKTREVAGIEVLDDHLLEFRLQEPRAFFLHLLALPAAQIARMEQGRPVGVGPFRPVRMDSQRIVLERHAGYFRPELPLLDGLEFRLYADRDEALARLKANEIDLVSGLYAEHTESGLEHFQVVAGSTPSCWFLAFNCKSAPYNDVRVRQGIRAGLDFEAVVERFHPGARVARTLTPPNLLEGVDALPYPRPDLALAQRLFRDAGVTHKLRITLPFPPGRSTEREDPLLFAPLIDAGLVELEHVELAANDFWQRAREGRLPCFRGGWIADYPDPDNFLHFILNSKAQTVYGLGYLNPELDRLTEEARTSIDPELRQQLYRKAEKLAAQDCPVVPLYHERIYAGASGALQGLRLHQIPPQVRFENLWLDPT
jgi:oligopeptide transport system substrate-binding protein